MRLTFSAMSAITPPTHAIEQAATWLLARFLRQQTRDSRASEPRWRLIVRMPQRIETSFGAGAKQPQAQVVATLWAMQAAFHPLKDTLGHNVGMVLTATQPGKVAHHRWLVACDQRRQCPCRARAGLRREPPLAFAFRIKRWAACR
jgi:hypothetical protein